MTLEYLLPAALIAIYFMGAIRVMRKLADGAKKAQIPPLAPGVLILVYVLASIMFTAVALLWPIHYTIWIARHWSRGAQ